MRTMRNWGIPIAALALAMSANGYAQDGGISSIKVSPSPARVGQPVTVVIDAGPAAPKFCGLTVDFGDSEGRDLKIDTGEGTYQFPVSQTKTYARAGTYTVKAKGKRVTTHFPCPGKAEASIVVEAAATSAAAAAPVAPPVATKSKHPCPPGYALQGKVGKAGDFSCKAGKGAARPEKVLDCKEGLEYFQTKTALGCRKPRK